MVFRVRSKNGSPGSSIGFSRKELVEQHLTHAKCFAHQFRSFVSGTLSMEDLEQAAVLGMCMASQTYSSTHSFKRYSEFRMLDEILALFRVDSNALSIGRVHRDLRYREFAVDFVEENGRGPTQEELDSLREKGKAFAGKIAQAIGNNPERLERARKNLDRRHQALGESSNSISLGDKSGVDGTNTVEDILGHGSEAEFTDPISDKRFLMRLLRTLDEAKLSILHAWFYEQKSLKEIGKDRGVTESRPCQIIRATINHLRKHALAMVAHDTRLIG